MGARLCCLRHSGSEYVSQEPNFCEQIEPQKSPLTENYPKPRKEKIDYMTLEDYLLTASPRLVHSPRIVGGELQVLRPTSKRVHPTSPEVNVFFTPRMSFSTGRLEKIDEADEYELSEIPISRIPSGKLKKRVSFKLPEEADIIFYSPTETFEE